MRTVLGMMLAMVAVSWTSTAAAADDGEEETRIERNVETRSETTTETKRRAPRQAQRQETESCASPATEPKPSVADTENHWYGWQTLIADGASIVTMPFVVGFGGYLLGGPIVHAAHGRWAAAGGDLGLRVGAPVVGFFGGAVLCGATDGGSGGHSGFGCLGPAVIGGVLGMIAAGVVDSAVIANERVEREKPTTTGVRWTPSASPRAGGGLDVGVGGTF